MSFSNVIPYFRDRVKAAGFNEWEDPFNFENIPANIIDKSFNIEIGPISSGPANQRTHEFTVPVVVRVFLKGFRNPQDTRDNAMQEADNIFNEVLKISNRIGNDIKDVRPSTHQPIQFSEGNDNLVILEMNFNAIVINCYS